MINSELHLDTLARAAVAVMAGGATVGGFNDGRAGADGTARPEDSECDATEPAAVCVRPPRWRKVPSCVGRAGVVVGSSVASSSPSSPESLAASFLGLPAAALPVFAPPSESESMAMRVIRNLSRDAPR